MNKGVIIAITIGVLAAFGAAGAFVFLRNDTPETSQVTGTNEQTSENSAAMEDNGSRGSLKSLLALAQNQECSFVDAESDSKGTVYVSGENMRGDFEVDSEVGTVASHVIINGDTMYLWMDDATDGFKTSLSEIEEATSKLDGINDPTTGSAVDLNQEVDYSCKPWITDPAKFSLPTDVTFTDFGQVMEDAIEGAVDDLNINCAECDKLPAGEAQDQCKQLLSC